MPLDWLHERLAWQVGDALVHPVYFGSAITGAGVEVLLHQLTGLLPAAGRDATGPVSGRVFKIERGPAGDKIAYVRVFSGTIATRDRVRFGRGREGKVTAISVFADGTAARRDEVTAGQIARLSGLAGIQVGDAIGAVADDADQHYFPPPTMETAMVVRDPRDKPRLHAAITELAEQDPLINVGQDDIRQEIYVSLYSEVQKQVIEATLAAEYGIEIGFRETTPICVERPVRGGAAEEILHAPGNPFGPQDFRKLTPLVVMEALRRAGTVVCEPVHHFRLETPADTLNILLPVLARLQAVASVSATKDSWCTVEGDIPVARVHELRQQIPPLTRGEGVMESAFDHYEPVRGPAPTRPRTDDNPLNREEYLHRHPTRRPRTRRTADQRLNVSRPHAAPNNRDVNIDVTSFDFDKVVIYPDFDIGVRGFDGLHR
jgi:translation elongation factor EF-G